MYLRLRNRDKMIPDRLGAYACTLVADTNAGRCATTDMGELGARSISKAASLSTRGRPYNLDGRAYESASVVLPNSATCS